MAHLVRQQRTRYVDRDGRRVPKDAPGAKKVREKGAKWYGVGIPGQGKKRIPLATDKEAAQRMLNDLVRAAERGAAQIVDRKAADRSLAEYLATFEADVALGLATKGGRRRRTPDPQQVKLVVQRARDLCSGCRFVYPGDLGAAAPAKLARYLADRLGKKRTKAERGISAQSANFFLAAARRFTRWLSARAAVRADLFDALPGYDAANERTHARREVSPEELNRVLTAARTSVQRVRKLPGPDRHALYLTAFATGFRASELAALTPRHFHLNADPPTVSLPGRVAKNKKAVRHPIPPAVAVALRSHLADRKPDAVIWPGKWPKYAARMLRVDLVAASVPYCVEGVHGKEYADFHALRHTFVSALAAAGTGAKELQTLARHSDPRLTLGTYSHARSAELVKAVSRLKVPGTVESPLAALDRDQLEGLVLGFAVLLDSLLGIPGRPAEAGLGTPRGTPAVGITGDSRELLGTNLPLRKPAG